MSLNITDPFAVNANVEYKAGNGSVYVVESVINYRCGYVYLLQLDGCEHTCIAVHEELRPHYAIEVGDAVIVGTQRHVVTSISADKLFAGLLGISGVVSMSKMELVPRVSVRELLDAMTIIYGSCNHALQTKDGIKMGNVEMMYGKIIADRIMWGRKPKR